ncbi:MAG: protein phosphatase CheZ [Ignavibacteria bacterium]|jgi:chemotaxis regulatin CheY-phosphate phosphatase CheZ|nr:protein phosphatase CheZ [Ignavibacteria bacterium]
MASQNFEQVFQKLGDLKSFFVYGQRLVPIFQKIIDFMQDTVPLLENVNQSIHESTSKIPKAAIQLNSVTNATELATNEILDTVDTLIGEVSHMKNKLSDLRSRLGNSKESLEPEVDAIIATVDKIEMGMLNITLSLQVQDITAQQLSSVNHLISSIQDKLASLLVDLNSKEIKSVPSIDEMEISKNAAFNPNARYEKSDEKQDIANKMVNQINNQTSQAEIDKLFAQK